MISYAGVIAQKIVCGVGSLGCESDLQRARKNAWGLLEHASDRTQNLQILPPFIGVIVK